MPPDEFLFDRLQEVGGRRLVQLEVAAAREPKCIRPGNDPAGVEQVEVGAYQVLRGEPTSPSRGNESRRILRHLHDGVVNRGAEAIAKHHQQRDPAIADQRERVTRRSCQRLGADKRQDLRGAFRTQLGALTGSELVPPCQRYDRRECTKCLILPLEQRAQPHAERVQGFLWAETAPIRRGHVVSTRHELFQRTDLRHHELVEIRREDAEKPHPRRKRGAFILGELEHAGVELEPREFGVQELLRRGARGILRRLWRRGDTQLRQCDAARVREFIRVRRIVPALARGECGARPFGDERRARRDRQRGKRAGIAQQRRTDARDEVSRGEPL